MLEKLLRLQRYPEYFRLLWWRKTVPISLRRAGVELGANVRFYGRPILSMFPGSRIIVGDRVSLCSVSEYTALGISHQVVLRTLRANATVLIGTDSGLSGTTVCAAVSVTIGRECLIGANVIICDTDFHAMDPIGRRYNKNPDSIAARPVTIGNNVFIGANAIILKGVTIGDNSVIGAGSVVTSDIETNCVATGNPAKFIKHL